MKNNHLEQISQQTGSPTRRRVLGWLVGIINLGVIGGVIAPVLGFISSPARKRPGQREWIPVLDEQALAPGEVRSVTYRRMVKDGYMTAEHRYSVYLYRKTDGSVLAIDPTCPHLGCRVEYKARKSRYVCPCHGGVFDSDGNLVSGPPPTGLTRLPTRVAEGKIWIQRG
jgi:Rieske Fe-S protein